MSFLTNSIKSVSILTAYLKLYRIGGAREDRTPDPLRARQVLSQLSYGPIIQVTDIRHQVSEALNRFPDSCFLPPDGGSGRI